MHGLIIILFAIGFGFTASGITANSYRLIAKKPETLAARILYAGVMVVAGPNVLFENAAISFKSKKCSSIAFWLASAIAGYWSFVIGLLVLSIYVAK